MKKLLALLLVALMAAGTSVSAYAATDITSSPAAGVDAGDYSFAVSGKFDASAPAAIVVSVDIAWDDMTFTYTQPSGGVWLPEEHRYEGVVVGGWSENCAGIYLTNHSNSDVAAMFSFASAIGNGTKGTFYSKDSNGNYKMIDDAIVRLKAGEVGQPDSAAAGAAYLGISGDGMTAAGKLGTVTVGIRSMVSHVSTAQELYDATLLGGTIVLLNDIDYEVDVNGDTDEIVRIKSETVLDLNGHVLSSKGEKWSVVYVYSEAKTCTIKNGTVKSTGTGNNRSRAVRTDDSKLYLENCTLISLGSYAVEAAGSVFMKDCTLTRDGSSPFVEILDGYEHKSGIKLSGTVTLTLPIGDDPSRLFRPNSSNDNVYPFVIEAGTYNFDPMSVLYDYDGVGYAGEGTIKLTKDEANNTYTVTENSVATTYKVTANDATAPTEWTVAPVTNP